MAIDTPATIAVLGAGPIGLEAALYARFLGYDVNVYERGDVAENIRRWGHVRLFSPFGMNRSPLGLAALAAQDATYGPPADSEMLAGREFADRYLIPLSQTDLLADSMNVRTRVKAIGKDSFLKTEEVGSELRASESFRLLLEEGEGNESTAQADIVIDATGNYGNHNWAGQGGAPAIGEQGLAAHIEYGNPDILGAARDEYAGRHTAVVGAGYSAATSVVALANLASAAPGRCVTWITRRAGVDGQGPVSVIKNDRLSERDRVARAANALALDADSPVRHIAGASIAAISSDAAGGFQILSADPNAERIVVEKVIANVGYQPDASLFAELQVHQCYASDGPMRLSAALTETQSSDCLDQPLTGGAALVTSEPNFYILGSKSYGRDSRFLMSIGIEQVRELFTIIGGRTDLNLYEGIGRLAS